MKSLLLLASLLACPVLVSGVAIADGRRVVWLDVNAKLVDAKGDVPTDLASDRLHPTEKGYRIWFDALERVVGK